MIRSFRALRSMSIACALVLALSTSLRAAEGPDLEAELPVDPRITMGTLENGMTYWIRPHDRPPGKVGVWLHFSSGSVNEEEDQRGLAHFLEHMAFNGSENFPPGTLIKTFEALGLSFGRHQNAFTSFDQTTYLLNLPDTKPETLDKALLYLSDVAWKLGLGEEEIEKERAVILEEARARKGYSQRITEKLLPILLPDSLVARRLPIGEEEVVAKAPKERFVSYYRKWYHPANAAILVVGDLEAERVLEGVAKHFKSWPAHPAPAEDASPGVEPYEETRAAVVTDPEKPDTEVSVVRVLPVREFKTAGDFRRELVEDLGNWIVNRRLSERVQKGEASYQNASVGVSRFLNVCTYVNAEANGKPDRCAPMMRELLTEVKRAREHGFLDQEFEDAKKETLEGARQAAVTEATWDARNFLSGWNSAFAQGRKPMSQAQRLELIEKLLPSIARAESEAAFRANFSSENRLLLATMPEKLDLPAPDEKTMKALAEEIEHAEVKALAAKERPKQLLEKDPQPGAVARQDEDKDLEILSVTFENGVRVHLRSMDFKKDHVACQIVMAGGDIEETAQNKGITDVAQLVFGRPATKQLDSTTIRDLMTGKQVQVRGTNTEDTLRLSVSGAPKDMEEGLRLAWLLLTQPKLEEPAVETWKDQKAQDLERAKSHVVVQALEKGKDVLSGGDARLRMLTPERVKELATAPAQAWLERILAGAYIEASFVGDMPREQMLALAAKYLGSLPKRAANPAALDMLRKVEVHKGPHEALVEVPTITPQALVLAGWRGADWRDVKERRILQMAAEILKGRVRDEVRENRGLAYSPSSVSRTSESYYGMGYFATVFMTDPGKALEGAKFARELMQKFAAEGPTPEEMDTVRKQLKNSLEEMMKQPGYWSGILQDLDYRGTKLSDVKEVVQKMTEEYTAEDIKAVLAKYLVEDGRFQIIAIPKTETLEPKKEEPKADPKPKPKMETKEEAPTANEGGNG